MLRGYIHALPKVGLHVHVVGSASVDIVLVLVTGLATPSAGVPADRVELAAFYARCCATEVTSTRS
jgi:aminodeoxyfutalosine deaminase